ncbi:MAG: metallophosphoesterase, partial [Proteobacteria bacterium]|nr:metallophosphoesterase [Pseudomonadota bacterium]
MKLLHTADWHLGRRFPTFDDGDQKTLSRARLDVLDNILLLAEQHDVDAILCAGDLFDEPNPDKEWWERLAQKLAQMRKPRPVILLPGNHDPLRVGSVYDRAHPFRTRLPAWVHVVDRDDFSLPLTDDAVLHARPCRSSAGSEDLALALPGRDAGDDKIRIGLVHGSTFDAVDCQINFPIDRDAAARRGFDYLAIGDTHGFREVPPGARPPVVYPGAPEATSFGERDAGNVALVFVTRARRVMVKPHPVAAWAWEECTVRTLAELRDLHARPRQGEPRGPRARRHPAGPAHADAARHPRHRGRAGRAARRAARDGGAPQGPRGRRRRGDRARGPLSPLSARARTEDVMRLVKLSVQRFQCIEAAEVEFGPGLNVLYGPNDTGKSSLAAAIRAVLLLQHGSTQHERFVSWYGGGEPPRVALTFADATERYWRIAKTFAGTAARTVLEESRDGRTFTGGVNGRAADEKLRQMLGWGMHTPGGGPGGPRGVPDTFLIQVLLAEQDDLRKIFASSLGDDPDESGRTRLTDALGALAQDPLFKKILLRAQVQHDRAFTGTGRKKRAAGSPFVEIDTRIKELDRERDELEGKVRATTVAEDAIGSLLRQRDALDADLREGREALATQQALVAVQQQRAAVEAEVTQHLVTIEGAAELQDAIATTTAQLSAVQADGEARTTRVEAARARATREEAARDRAREAYEALTSEPAVDHARGALVHAHERARDGLAEATTAAAQASAALATATSAGKTLADAIAAHDVAATVAGDAERAGSTAATTLDAARRALLDAEQRVREATSADQARARELRRSELENQRLTCLADRPRHQAELLHLRAIRTALAEAATATATCATLETQGAAARHASELATTAVATIEVEHVGLVGLQRCGQAAALRERLAVAEQHAEEARVLAVRARALRDDERVLRGGLRAGLPTTAAIAALRRLRDELRIAEAKVEVGLAVVVRPRRPLAIRSRVDGGQEVTSPSLAEPRAFTAKRAATIAIDDLVEIEISAGDEAARANVAALRARWEAEGTHVLQAHGAETVEALEAVRAQADADGRVADALGKDAAAAEQHAAQLAGLATDAGELRAQLASVEQELVATDRQALEESFARLGSGWHVAIKTSLAAIERRRRPAAEAVDVARATLARLDAQLDAQRATAAAAMRTAQELAAASPGEVDELEARSTEALDEIDREVRNLDGILARLSNDASGEEAAARTALATATTSVTVAGEANARLAAAATAARGAVIQAATRVEGARAQAAALDVHGAWSGALDGRSPLALDAWATRRAATADALAGARTTLDAASVALARFDEERAATLKAARDVRDTADTSARAAR